MPQNLADKKGQWLSGLVNAAIAWEGARNQMKTLVEERNTNADISGINQADIDAAVALGYKVAHLIPLYLDNFTTVAQPDWEQLLSTGNVSRGAAELIHYLRLLPN